MPTYGRRGFESFPASKPLPAEGGIASSKTRGAMATTWWSKRFTDVLESYGLGGRMTRGKSYARKGQVLSLLTANGVLRAEVQGSRSKPYDVTVTMQPPSDAQWASIEELLQSRVGYAAAMLAGEIPTDLEALFVDAGCSLFPSDWRSLRATCSCPDWGDPCKHQAAVLYVFADQLDADPWQLLQWHGRSRDDVLALFAAGVGGPGATDGVDKSPAWIVAPWWPLRVDATSDATSDAKGVVGAVGVVGVDVVDCSDAASRWRHSMLPVAVEEPGAALRQLGPLDVALSAGQPVQECLAAIYESLREVGP
jgi:uncharacterized Zn finger protein